MLQVADGSFDDSSDVLESRLIDALPVAAVVCDADGGVVSFNAQAIELAGRDLRRGDQLEFVLPLFEPDGTPVSGDEHPVAEALRTGEMVDRDLCLERNDGRQAGVRITARALTNENGTAARVLATFQDAPSDRTMNADRATLAAIVDSSDDAIVSKTLDGVITSWNAAAERIFGYSASEAVGQHISLIIPSDRLAEEHEVLARLRRGQTIDHFETVRQRKDGRLIDISITVSPIRGSDGRIVGASKVARDVTEKNAAHNALRQSQQRYRRLFDSAGVSLWEIDLSRVKAAIDRVRRDGLGSFREYLVRHPEFVDRCLGLVRVADVNGSTLRMLGARSQGELVQNLARVFDESTRDAFKEELVAIAEGRTEFEAEVRLRSLAGERIDAMASIRFPQSGASSDPDSSFDSVLVGLTDITLRRVAEDTLRAEGQIRETLANVGASLASELNPERLIQAVTDAATHLTSAEFGAFFYCGVDDASDAYSVHALAGANEATIRNEAGADVRRVFANAFRHEGIVRLDDLAAEPGRPIHDALDALVGPSTVRSYLAVPVVSRSREVLGGLLFGHSKPGVFVTRHEQLASGIASWAALALDNARLYKTARDANTAKDEFLATLSHELRTPLNAMLGWTHLLRSGTLAKDMRQKALDAVERNGRAQAQLVDDLLDVSRIVSGRFELKDESVDLGSVLTSAIDTIRPAAAAKELNVRLIRPETDILVTGDADRLRQIFWNLLTNAVRFTPPHGSIEIEMRLADSGTGVDIDVRDTGIGIRPDFLAHVFERFRQADGSHSRKHGGLGLGLAIVRHLAEAHGGSVAVDSRGEGLGATFTVHLPVNDVHRTLRPSAGEIGKRGAALENLRILVVDDERDAREFLAALLSLHGATVELAASAGEALGIIAGTHIDVLLADLGLPGQDGYSLIHAIRSLDPERGGAVPAVAVTAYAGLRERTRALEAGYGWHVAKPVDPDQLLTVVSAAGKQVTTGHDG